MTALPHLLPAPGAVWGPYPERRTSAAGWTRVARAALAAVAPARGEARLPPTIARAMNALRTALDGDSAPDWHATVNTVRARLRACGTTQQALGEGLALAGAAMQRALGKSPYETQYIAAWLMLDGHFAEMATGEGKTLATALAAAVAAMGGTPVHVLTANEYLVARDCEQLQPFFAALGLRSAAVVPGMAAAERRAAYRCDIVYATGKDVAFDYLRDHLLLRGERCPLALSAHALCGAEPPLLSGLCMALIDEADSILLEEACVPLILAAPAAEIDAAAFRTLFAIAGRLWRNRDYRLDASSRRATLTETGSAAVAAAVATTFAATAVSLSGELAVPRRACEMVAVALAARHLYRRDREYVVTPNGVEIIDETTGRLAAGRRWSNGLHQMLEIKEGLTPSAPSSTTASLTFQRFFPRYLRLGGMSGTLREARRELQWLFGRAVRRVPLAKPNRRRWLGLRMFASNELKWQAALARVQEMRARGRPVLLGTDSVAASHEVAQRLAAAGIAHQVLNAVQDADEAQRIARAGQRGMVTVATNIAGRGTDIRLDAAAAAAGGLHVIACVRNRARRIDRQLIGRAGRHGDPGSAEAIVALEDALLSNAWPRWLLRCAASLARGGRVPQWLVHVLVTGAQRRSEWRDFAVRRELLLADRHSARAFGFLGGIE